MKRERTFFGQTFLKVIALENLFYRHVGRQAEETGRVEFVHPARIEIDYRFVRIEQFKDLRLVGFGVRVDLLAGKLRAGRTAA